jgi:serine/threonine protein kinase
MIGQTISHYRILEKIGEGGMGVVYKALDTNLDRTVALKFMPHHLAPDDAESARFLQEAKAASALNHPNVCTIYGIHDESGHRFIEMEYVEGRTLRQKLPVGSVADAIRYGIQIGDALHEAHIKGIVHRDIKADNIMINSRDQVKVMDFGLAKLKGSLKITKATSTVGTLAYMAPEQIQGSDVDGRSDIFSFGVVLYEMLTGRLPFRSEHEAALMYSILNDEPEPIQKHLPEIQPVLANLIQRALEKDPNDRYQSINEMVIELRRLQKQSTKVSRASLASMPANPGPGTQSSTAVRDLAQAPGSSGSLPIEGPKKRRKGFLIGGIAAAVTLVFSAVWYFLVGPSSGPAINPDMTFRTLEIPFKEIGIPSLSGDGGWVAFPGNARGTSWDIFLMNTGSGEPRQVTNDSSGFMASAQLSPDGSQIVYDRADKGFTRPEVAVVSSLGGFS